MLISELKQNVGAKGLSLDAEVLFVYRAENRGSFWSQGVKVKDGSGEESSMKLGFDTEQQALQSNVVGQMMNFKVNVVQKIPGGPIYLNGHLGNNPTMQTQPQYQPPPQQAQQAPQQAAQPPINKDLLIVRQNVLNRAVDMAIAQGVYNNKAIEFTAEYFKDYVFNGPHTGPTDWDTDPDLGGQDEPL